jgi:hypothetical protein
VGDNADMGSSDGAPGRSTARVLAAGGLGALLVACGVAVAPALERGDERAAAPATTAAARPAAPRAPVIVRVPVAVVATYDPDGDDVENDAEAPLAADADPATAWTTERYETFFKPGVGLVLDAGASRRLQRVDVVTGRPGVRAEVHVGATADGPFRRVGAARTLDATTAFPVAGARGRYVLVLITAIPDGGTAEIAEVRVRARR